MSEDLGDDLGGDEVVAQKALEDFDLPPGSALRLLNLSENATFAVEEPGLSLIHISEPTRLHKVSRMPSSA